MPADTPTGVSVDVVLAVTGRQLIETVQMVRNEAAMQIAQRDHRIVELEAECDDLRDRLTATQGAPGLAAVQ